ncbi:MAG TPA: TonB-dependent receptor [Balneolaceae bacterium]
MIKRDIEKRWSVIAKRMLLLCMGLIVLSQTSSAQQVTASVFEPSVNDQEAFISVHFENEPLGKALHKIARKVRVGISYETTITPSRLVTYQAKNKPVFNVLDDILVNTKLYATLSKNRKVIVIKEKKEPVPEEIYQSTITGTVTDGNTGETMPGVNILVLGTTMGATTDLNGHYSLEVKSLQDTLRFSFIGYASQIVPINGRTNIDVALKSSTQALEQLIVTGVGITGQKKSLGQSVSSINSESIENAPVSTVNQVLAGRIPGVVAVGGGEVGSAAPIRLRGTISLTQRNGPLIYIDGVRIDTEPSAYGSLTISPLSRINPEIIDRIVVLKGSAAAALFGTEASAGVIQIFTKKGINKPTRFTFKTTQKFSKTPLGRIPKSTVYNKANDQFLSVSPAKHFFNIGHGQEYNLSVRGGTDEYGYFISGKFENLDGSLPTTGVRSLNMRSKLTVRPIDGMDIQIGLNVIGRNTEIPYPSWGLMGEFVLNDPSNKSERRPYGELYHSIPGVLAFDNILNNRIVNMSTQLNYQFNESLSTHFLVGHVTGNQRYKLYVPPGPDIANPTGMRQITDTRSENTTLELTLTAKTQISNDLSSNTTVGAQSYWDKKRSNLSGVKNFPVKTIQVLNGATTVTGVSEFFKEVISAGAFAQEKIGYKDRLFLTGGVRVDGNSTFGEGFGFVVYPHFGLSWVVSDEPFWNSEVISNLRLRSSYGVSGLQPGVYDKLRTWSLVSLLGNKPVLIPNSYGNENLKPERSREIEIGANLGFFNDQVTLDITYYRQNTVDAILARERAPSAGYLNPQLVNIGSLKGQGLEISANFIAIDNRNLKWNVFATFAKRKQIVDDLGGVPSFRVGGDGRRWNSIMEGYQPGAVIGPVLDPGNSYDLSVTISQFTDLSQLSPNFLIDEDGNRVRRFLGNQLPTSIGSLGMTFNLRKYNISVSALLSGAADFVIHNETEQVRVASQITPKTALWISDLSDPTTSDERRREIAEAYIKNHPLVVQDWIENGNYLKLQEVSLSWGLPESVTNKFNINSASLTVAGRNLFVLTPYEGVIVPGTTSSSVGSNSFAANIDYFGAPTPRIVEFSFRMSF